MVLKRCELKLPACGGSLNSCCCNRQANSPAVCLPDVQDMTLSLDLLLRISLPGSLSHVKVINPGVMAPPYGRIF